MEMGKCSIIARIEGTNEVQSEIQYPKECVIKINTDDLIIEVKKDNTTLKTFKVDLSDDYPYVEMIKKTNNMFDINLSKELQIRIQARSNTLRDIIAVAVRSFCGKKIIQKSSLDEVLEEIKEVE